MTAVSPAEILALHREIVAIPSVSGDEVAVRDHLAAWLTGRGAQVEILGRNLIARTGRGPCLALDSHYDTVPPSGQWEREPHEVTVEDGRVHGLGANDAKAAVAAMCAAFVETMRAALPVELYLILVCDEETGGEGTEAVLPELARRGVRFDGVVVGEPTGLDLATSQKGMLLVDLVGESVSCHSAHARRLGVPNPITSIARDLVAIAELPLAPVHAALGPTTCEPTLMTAGVAKNMVPGEARCTLDLRTVPTATHAEVVAALEAITATRVEPRSLRLEPRECPADATVLRAARHARPEARLYGSPTMSDLVYFADTPAVKVGPGDSERSHRPDEFVLESEILAGADFYTDLVNRFAEVADTARERKEQA